MRNIVVLLVVLMLAISAAAMAGEYFSPIEEAQIRQTVAEVLPGAKVDFSDTEIKGAGILIGPLPDGKNLFIHVNDVDEIFIYQPPAEYEQAAWEIIKTAYRIIDSRPASDPHALGRNLLERQGIK